MKSIHFTVVILLTTVCVHSDEILPAYKRAVREALLKHKRSGVPAVIERDGKMVILQPDEINIEDE
ncbi:MAG TPA: hypothetical protein VGJ02_02940 [Pyrinomonadaceae bacterium]